MKKIAVMFPGQGAQFVGMGNDIFNVSGPGKRVFDRAAEIYGQSFLDIMFDGPEETLKETVNTQPAIFVMSMALFEAFKEAESGFEPAVFCGLSVGELAAVCAAGAVDLEVGLKLIKKRAELMDAAANNCEGSMSSILGLEVSEIEKICLEAGCYIANLNAAGQTVISGTPQSVEKTEALCVEAGAKRAIRLKVSGAFHTPLMSEASTAFGEFLEGFTFNVPGVSVVSNVDALLTDNPDTIKTNLSLQIQNSVRWMDSVLEIKNNGIDTFIEIGPGKVLKGLLRKIDSSLTVCNIEKLEDIDNIMQQIKNAV